MDPVRLFRPSCVALVATSMSFGFRGNMYLMRQFLGQIPQQMSPTLLVAITAPIAAEGLCLFGIFVLIHLSDRAKGGYRVEGLASIG